MNGMFYNARKFNQPLFSWDVTRMHPDSVKRIFSSRFGSSKTLMKPEWMPSKENYQKYLVTTRPTILSGLYDEFSHYRGTKSNTKGTKRFHGTQNVDDGVYMNVFSYMGSLPGDEGMVKRAKTIKGMKEEEIRTGTRTIGGRKIKRTRRTRKTKKTKRIRENYLKT